MQDTRDSGPLLPYLYIHEDQIEKFPLLHAFFHKVECFLSILGNSHV